MKAILLVLAVPIVLLAACARFAPGAGGSPSPESSHETPDLAGAWVLRQGSGPDGDIVVPDGARITLRFEDDEVGGQACNHYGGAYELRPDGSISFSAMAMTEMACAEPMMTVEAAYHAALAAITHVVRAGDTLTLSGDATELSFELVPPVPDAALRGTRWTLDSLIDGDAVSSVQAEAWLVLRRDGTMTGSTGCRDLTGNYVVTGDQLTWTDLRADGECGKRLEEQDRHVIEVIEQPIVKIAGNQLTLTLPNGTGLAYHSA
jgi:heat shock protein HslJ